MPALFNLDQEIMTARKFVANNKATNAAKIKSLETYQDNQNLRNWVDQRLKNIDLADYMRRRGMLKKERHISNESPRSFHC